MHFHVSDKPSRNATKFWITSYGAIIQDGNNTSKVPTSILKDIIRQVQINPELVIDTLVEHFGTIRFIDQQ